MSNFKVGDVVQLKSGGPLMTVKQSPLVVNKNPVLGMIVCTWFADKELTEARFDVAVLMLAK
ncbi:YodC family protein [Delftia tsuruhatensis]|uniref:YodC family protein n=1 Tax=Delftia tsuruhatensis TaxID=180282 RepID=UPI0031DDC365